MAVVCTAAVLPSAVVWLVPYSSHCSAGEYCSACRALLPIGSGAVVWVQCVSVVFVWWGILCLLPPHSGGGWGRRGWWGAVVVVGGMVSEGRGVLLTPRRMTASPACVLTSPLSFTLWPY